MTNGEWLEAKRDAFINKIYNSGKKFADWLWKHIWLPILILTILMAAIITVSILIEEVYLVLIIPVGCFWAIFILVGFSECLDKEHKEKRK